MSYSACDFLEACDHAADAYDVPPLPVSTLEEMGIPTDEGYIQEEDEQQRALAERVTRALRQRARLLEACQQAEHWLMQPDRTVEPTDMLRALRAAIAEAEEGA